MDASGQSYTRERMIAFLTAWMRQEPTLSLAAAREEGRTRGFNVSRREYEEARKAATGSALHPEHAPESALAPREAASPPPMLDEPSAVRWFSDDVDVPVERAPRNPAPFASTFASPNRESSPPQKSKPAAPPPAATPPTLAESTATTTDATREFLVEFLRANPNASYLESKVAAGSAGVRLPSPIDFGLARKIAGLALPTPKVKPETVASAPIAPEVEAPKAKAASAPPELETRRETQPAPKAKAAARVPARSTGDPFEDARRILADRERYLNALKAIAVVVGAALKHK